MERFAPRHTRHTKRPRVTPRSPTPDLRGEVLSDEGRSEMPFSTRCKSRKEKNKLASRACRLKKKAQHEANKLKCHGLEQEHRESN